MIVDIGGERPWQPGKLPMFGSGRFRKKNLVARSVVLVALLGVGALAAPPSSVARTFYLGINANTRSAKDPGKEQDRVAEAGATRLREDVDWEKIEPTNNSWEWSSTDTLYLDAAERDMTILPVLNSPPCWAVPKGTAPEDCGKTYPISDVEYSEFVARVAERYGPGGDFWEAHPGLDGSLASRQFEIWNEPYIEDFVNGVVDPARYAALYKAAVIAGRAGNSATRYLVESTVDVWDTTTKEWVNWAATMVKAEPAIGSYIDGIAIHPYPGPHDPYYEPSGGTDESLKNTDLIYKNWSEHGIKKPIWITETGYSSCTNEERCVPGATQAERESKKAEWLSDLFTVLGESQYSYVHAVYLYNFRQWLSASEPTSNQGDWYGIVDNEANHLPAWSSFMTAIEKYDGVPVSDTTITGNTVTGHNATFSFSTADSTASLECQLDSEAWSNCVSPKSYSELSTGSHMFQVRATNAEGTEASPASYSWWVSDLSSMAVTDPFNGSTSAVSNFGSNWSALGWASGASAKGEDRSSGWGPVASFPTVNGAFFTPTVTDTGAGVAAVATMAKNPSSTERYFSVWLDMSSPASTRAGYELRFTDISANTYNVSLSKWVGGVQTILASKLSYSFINGGSFAVVDQGNTVSVWTNTGAGFGQLLSANDSSFGSGSAGVEASGNVTRLTNFKVGTLLAPVANMDVALKTLPVNGSFETSECPLSDSGAWAALGWDSSKTGHNTGCVVAGWGVVGGWGPYDGSPWINGAYWQKASFTDSGAGDAVVATLHHAPGVISCYFSLWLNMPSPASGHTGYELRFKETNSSSYEVVISRWESGTKTVLVSKMGYLFPIGSRVALVERAGTVSVWTNTGSEYTQLLAANDSKFTSGYTGIEASGNMVRLKEFRSGPLPPF